jgi:hypothetical protein
MLANVVSCTLVSIDAAQIDVERAINRDLRNPRPSMSAPSSIS